MEYVYKYFVVVAAFQVGFSLYLALAMNRPTDRITGNDDEDDEDDERSKDCG